MYLCVLFLTVHDKLTCEVSSTWDKQFVYIGPKRKRQRKNVEVIQAEIVGHGYLYLCAMFLTVHDKLTCEVSSTWAKQFVYIGPKRKRQRKNVEVIQAEIVGHCDLYLCAILLTVHDKLACEVSSTWTKQFAYIGPKRKRQRKNVEVIQAEIVGHIDLHLSAMF